MTQHGVVSNTFWLKAKTAVDARFIGLADGVIACSADLLPRMRAWCPRGKLVCIPNGVEQPSPLTALKAREVLRERFGARTSGALIGYVGRLSHEKRPDRLISLVARARATGRDVHGLIVGSGPLRSALEKQARALDVSEEITFTGMMQELNVVYGALDALVALSDTEATPRVVVEAMAASVPIVASTVGGLPDMLDHGRAGMLVPPDDERAWLAALVEALDDPGPRTDAARRLAEEQYSIATMGRRVETFYRELMAARGPL